MNRMIYKYCMVIMQDKVIEWRLMSAGIELLSMTLYCVIMYYWI